MGARITGQVFGAQAVRHDVDLARVGVQVGFGLFLTDVAEAMIGVGDRPTNKAGSDALFEPVPTFLVARVVVWRVATGVMAIEQS